MSVDRWGSPLIAKYLRRYDFPRNEEGDYIFGKKRLKGVEYPKGEDDAATKGYVDGVVEEIKRSVSETVASSIAPYEEKHKKIIEERNNSSKEEFLRVMQDRFRDVSNRLNTLRVEVKQHAADVGEELIKNALNDIRVLCIVHINSHPIQNIAGDSAYVLSTGEQAYTFPVRATVRKIKINLINDENVKIIVKFNGRQLSPKNDSYAVTHVNPGDRLSFHLHDPNDELYLQRNPICITIEYTYKISDIQ